MENAQSTYPVDRLVSAALRIAETTVRQWDEHDRFRMTDEDRLFYEGEIEPGGVTMARAVIVLVNEVKATIEDNLHLADGDDCTLRRLVRLFPDREPFPAEDQA